MDNFLNPVQEKVEEWKKTTTQLEKDHTKGEKALHTFGEGRFLKIPSSISHLIFIVELCF